MNARYPLGCWTYVPARNTFAVVDEFGSICRPGLNKGVTSGSCYTQPLTKLTFTACIQVWQTSATQALA